jgi:hypothetical protein
MMPNCLYVFFTPRVLLPGHPGYISVLGRYIRYISWRRATTTLQKLYQLGKGKIGFKIILKKARVRVLKSFANLYIQLMVNDEHLSHLKGKGRGKYFIMYTLHIPCR